ncbi:MAG: hypothetical protein IK126_02735 [Bacteroidales bacterium]|nr:hypothetical protein [Bacteroidales bacterium]
MCDSKLQRFFVFPVSRSADFWKKRRFFPRFAACFWSVSAIFEKKFRPQRTGSKSGAKKVSEKAKKNFGGSENGCIFAPAFDRGSGREKARLPEGKRTLKQLGR